MTHLNSLHNDGANELFERVFDIACPGKFLAGAGDVTQTKQTLLGNLHSQHLESGRRLKDLI